MARKSPINILYIVASGAFGKDALSGGAGMALAGLGFHYLIAGLFAVAYYWLSPWVPALLRHDVWAGLLFGTGVWGLMNLVVVPNSQAPGRAFNPVSAAIGLGILIGCIGLPIAIRAARYYARRPLAPPAG